MPPRTVSDTLADLHRGVQALDVAVDALQGIALMGGPSADRAKTAIEKVGVLLTDAVDGPPMSIREAAERAGRAEDRFDTALGQGRR